MTTKENQRPLENDLPVVTLELFAEISTGICLAADVKKLSAEASKRAEAQVVEDNDVRKVGRAPTLQMFW